jgi:hypothetical protein
MSWRVYQWLWRLESPLFVGMPPAGSLNRTRLYIPARALHGAFAAESARRKYDEDTADDKTNSRDSASKQKETKKTLSPDYGKFGKELGTWCRFSYLFPAEKIDNQILVWLPQYFCEDKTKHDSDNGRNHEERTGLYWVSQSVSTGKDLKKSDQSLLTDRAFRRLLLDVRTGTAINPGSDAALDGSLREMEYINPWWRSLADSQVSRNPVYLFGYVFLKDNGFKRKMEAMDTLFIGGDTRYGLGKIVRDSWQEAPVGPCFGGAVDPEEEEPEVYSDRVLGHAFSFTDREIHMRGNKELPGGWEISGPWMKQKGTPETEGNAGENKDREEILWSPGSSASKKMKWGINTHGIWYLTDKGARTHD